MDSPDQSFLNEYKPLHVPHKYDPHASTQDNVIYALAQLEQASADDVALKLDEFEPSVSASVHKRDACDVLMYLFDKGLIKVVKHDGVFQFNLSKILIPNSGKADNLF